MTGILRPATVDQALDLLAAHAPRVRILAGGTDLMVRLKEGLEAPERLLCLDARAELRGIREEGEEIVLGALATHEEIARSPLLRRPAPVLADGSASVGGNVANASPAADAVPPLHALDAVLVLRSRSGTRTVPIGEFAHGPRATVLRPDELLAEIRFPRPAEGEVQIWSKVGQREALACAKISLAFRARREDGVLRGVRVAVGAAAPTVFRARRTEAALEGGRRRRRRPGRRRRWQRRSGRWTTCGRTHGTGGR